MNDVKYHEIELITDIDVTGATFSIEAIHDDYEGFRILAKVESPKEQEVYRLHAKSVIVYQNTDELYIRDVKHALTGFCYEVEHSKYLEYIRRRADGKISDEAKHYFLSTEFDCIDIITEYELQAEML